MTTDCAPEPRRNDPADGPSVDAVMRGVEEGKRLLLARDYNAAVALFDRLHRAEPNRPSLLLWLHDALAGAGRLVEALQAARQAALLGPQDLPAPLKIAELCLRLRRESETMRVARAARRRFPNDPRPLALLVKALSQRRRFKQALAVIEAAAERESTADLLVLKAETLLAMEDFSQLKQLLADLGPLRANAPRILHVRAKMHAALGETKLALQAERALVVHEPAKAEHHAQLGVRLYRLGHYQEAMGHFDQALKRDPANVLALNHRFEALSRLGRKAEARETALRLATVAPGREAVQMKLSRAHIANGDRAGAEQAMRTSFALRSRGLPPTLAEGLARIRANPQADVPEVQLNWAWRNLAPPGTDRAAWERAARFGVAANRLLDDWFDCAPGRSGEFDALTLPPDDAVANALRSRNRGVLLIGAHVGPLAVGVHFYHAWRSRLHLMTIGPRKAFSGQPDCFINAESRLAVRGLVRAVDRGVSVALLADSPNGLNTFAASLPDGTRVRLMRRIPRAIWRYRIDSVYCFPLWEGEHIRIHVDPDAPAPMDDEPYPEWEARWAHGYLAKILSVLRTGPENFRLHGGLWDNL